MLDVSECEIAWYFVRKFQRRNCYTATTADPYMAVLGVVRSVLIPMHLFVESAILNLDNPPPHDAGSSSR